MMRFCSIFGAVLRFLQFYVPNVYMYMLAWRAPIQRTLELNGLDLILNFHWNLRQQNQARFATFYLFFFFLWLARSVKVLTSFFSSCKQLA